MNVSRYYSFLEQPTSVYSSLDLHNILTSHLVLGLYLTLILKIFIPDGQIDDNF